MRVLCEIFIVGALLYFGWEEPYKQWIDQVRGQPTVTTATATPGKRAMATPVAAPSAAWVPARPQPATSNAPAPRPSPQTKSGDWMWDPSHRSPLDPPRKHPSPR